MQLKETAFCNNVTTDKHSNPDWGAEVGQGSKKLMNVEGVSELLNGMLYYKIDDINRIEAVLGKTNRKMQKLGFYAPNTSIVIASLFEKVAVNGKILEDAKFIMFVTKDERELDDNNQPNTHKNRRYLKFPYKCTLDGISYNEECIKKISRELGCNDEGSWVVTDINFVDDYLSFKAIVIDKNNPCDFKNKIERSTKLKRIKFIEAMEKFKPSDYVGDLSPIILYGPPGTGKTLKMQVSYIYKFDEENRFVTTFHQSFSYEEFVEGLKPVLSEFGDEGDDVKYQIVDGIFKQACERAANMAGYASLDDCLNDTYENRKEKIGKAKEERKYVLLCIDEINRGNVAAIFGDLISLIETSKRLGAKYEMTAMLPYSKKKFGVPDNLLIVGTMNTADRSIQLLDSALRRRFVFKELGPNYDVFAPEASDDDNVRKIKSTSSAILSNMNAKIRCLLNKDNQIGHSYFLHAESYDDIYDALKNKIIPLLEEYFYNDVEKIRFVLSDHKKGDSFYVEDENANEAYKLFTKDNFDDENKKFYKLREERPRNCEAFLQHMLPKNKDEVNEQE